MLGNSPELCWGPNSSLFHTEFEVIITAARPFVPTGVAHWVDSGFGTAAAFVQTAPRDFPASGFGNQATHRGKFLGLEGLREGPEFHSRTARNAPGSIGSFMCACSFRWSKPALGVRFFGASLAGLAGCNWLGRALGMRSPEGVAWGAEVPTLE